MCETWRLLSRGENGYSRAGYSERCLLLIGRYFEKARENLIMKGFMIEAHQDLCYGDRPNVHQIDGPYVTYIAEEKWHTGFGGET